MKGKTNTIIHPCFYMLNNGFLFNLKSKQFPAETTWQIQGSFMYKTQLIQADSARTLLNNYWKNMQSTGDNSTFCQSVQQQAHEKYCSSHFCVEYHLSTVLPYLVWTLGRSVADWEPCSHVLWTPAGEPWMSCSCLVFFWGGPVRTPSSVLLWFRNI